MLPKHRKKEYILDKMHRGFVNVCIAASIVSGSVFFYGIYRYLRYVRPEHKKLRLENEEGLLAEGRPLTEIAAEIAQ